MQRSRLIIVTLSFLFLSSCSSINPLDILNPDKPSFEISTQLGKTNESEKNNIKVEEGKTEIKQDAESISNDHTFNADKIDNITQGMSRFELILFSIMAGIAISPQSIKALYSALGVIVKDTYNAILTPFVSLGDYILKLFKR